MPKYRDTTGAGTAGIGAEIMGAGELLTLNEERLNRRPLVWSI